MSSVHKIKNLNKESNIYYHANSDMFNLLVELIENNWQSFSQKLKLKTPENISENNNGELIWDAVENDKIYEIYNSGVALKQTNSTRFTIPNKVPATYVFSIKALGWGNLITSDSSSALTVVVRKLESPTIVLNSTDNYISWNYIQYAEKYDVYINGYKIT